MLYSRHFQGYGPPSPISSNVVMESGDVTNGLQTLRFLQPKTGRWI